MANIEFYERQYGLTSTADAFQKFFSVLQNYYDATYYVDWRKVLSNAQRFEPELALLSTLCRKPDRVAAARDLLAKYPQVIRALPILIGTRGSVAIVNDLAQAEVSTFTFQPDGSRPPSEVVDQYASFLAASGLIELLDHVGSLSDYVVGVEVGMDTNARKNRGGACGIRAIDPWVQDALSRNLMIEGQSEVSSVRLRQMGCELPASANGLVWDYGFWSRSPNSRRFVVMEVNHYGSSGSKPSAIAREYTARQLDLHTAGVGFIWVTDGLGWHLMRNPLREAFQGLDWLINVRLAADGMVAFALEQLLLQ